MFKKVISLPVWYSYFLLSLYKIECSKKKKTESLNLHITNIYKVVYLFVYYVYVVFFVSGIINTLKSKRQS